MLIKASSIFAEIYTIVYQMGYQYTRDEKKQIFQAKEVEKFALFNI